MGMDLASLAQLDRSHRRHDSVVEALLAAARRLAMGRPDPGDTDAVQHAVGYFQRAGKRHFLDEEGSVFPRLSTRRPQLAEQLATLSSEHPAQIALQNAIAEAAQGLTGSSQLSAGKRVLELAERLADLHRTHVAREDRLFEAAGDALTAEDDAEIVIEMETRRDRDGDRGGGGGGGGRRSSKPTSNLKPMAAATAKRRASVKTARVAKPAKRRAGVKKIKTAKPVKAMKNKPSAKRTKPATAAKSRRAAGSKPKRKAARKSRQPERKH